MKIGTDGVLLGAWSEGVGGTGSALDIGSGCGLISLMIAQRFPAYEIDGVELSDAACQDCRSNFESSPWGGRLNVINEDFTKMDFSGRRYDLIVSNPPFFVTGEKALLKDRSLARHESTLTYKAILERSRGLLKPDGRLSLIAPIEREEEIIFDGEMLGLKVIRLCRVAPTEGRRFRRIMAEFSLSDDKPMSITKLALRNPDNTYTREYINLTKDFYINF